MGLFSGIKKFFSKVWKGVKKVFKAVTKPIAKLFDSKIGKALILAVSVFSMGSALLAGGKGFLAGEGFIGKFLNGGKEFLNSLLGTKFDTVGNQAAGGAANIAPGAQVENIGAAESVSAGDVLTGGVDPASAAATSGGLTPAADAAGSTLAEAGTAAAAGGGGAPGSLTNMNTMQNLQKPMSGPGKIASSAGKESNWLQKAASAAKDFASSTADFAKTPGGGYLLGGVIGGIGAGMQQNEMNRFNSRVERMFADPNDPGMQLLNNFDYSVDAPRGLAAAPGRLSQRESIRTGRYQPSVPYGRPAGG